MRPWLRLAGRFAVYRRAGPGHADRMPVLTTTPEECPRGHQLGPGRVLVGWQTCLCLSAEQSGRRGHHTHTCDACHEEGYRTICYDPPHATQALPVFGDGEIG